MTAILLLARPVVLAPSAAAAPPPTSGFEKVKLEGGLVMGEIIELAVLPDQKVLHINRGTTNGGGQVRLYNPATRTTSVVLTVPLVNRISRFTFNRTNNTMPASTEDILIEWPTQRDLCCHSAGSMSWDTAGNLYFAVGDNTNSGGDSAGMAPIDERTSRHSLYDAQRTSGNTNDLRGKINRIHPEDNGTYTVPSGNLFAPGTARTRPEIYIMGVRNPYRVWVDKRANNTLYWADVGPDANATIPNRGPAAYDEFNRATAPGNYGWPYCGGPNGWFPCGGSAGPVNNSPRNTGLQQLPPTRPALVWEQHGGSREWPALDNPNGCGAPNHTEVYHFDPNLNSDVKWPQYYDNGESLGEQGQRACPADGFLLQRGKFRSGRQPADLCLGLHQRRPNRLHRREPHGHLHHQRQLPGQADRQRRHRQVRHDHRPDRGRQRPADASDHLAAGRRDL